MVFSIIFSWLSKVIRLYSGLDYITNDSVLDPGTIESWFILRITEFRFTFVFLLVAIFISYVLKVNLFEKGYNQTHKLIVIGFGTIGVLYLLVIYSKGKLLFDLFAFIIVSVYMFMIYFPFMISCYKAGKNVEESIYKKAFFSLVVMALCFILILICQLLDRVLIIMEISPGYTPFYFAGWTFAIIGLIGAYLGYIRPKSRE